MPQEVIVDILNACAGNPVPRTVFRDELVKLGIVDADARVNQALADLTRNGTVAHGKIDGSADTYYALPVDAKRLDFQVQ